MSTATIPTDSSNFIQEIDGPARCMWCGWPALNNESRWWHVYNEHLNDIVAGRIKPLPEFEQLTAPQPNITTLYLECQKRCGELELQYEGLRALINGMTTAHPHVHDFAPEGSALAFLRWEEMRRTEEYRRDGKNLTPSKRALMRERLSGFSDAVSHLTKCAMAYDAPVIGEIR